MGKALIGKLSCTRTGLVEFGTKRKHSSVVELNCTERKKIVKLTDT